MKPSFKRTLRKAENVLTALDHDLLIAVAKDVKWIIKNQYFLWLVLLALEGFKLL